MTTTKTKTLPANLEDYRDELVRQDFTEFALSDDGRHLWGRRPEDGLWQAAFGVAGGR